MDPSTLESDLLDLIEGRLAPERQESVRAALSKDPVLLREVRAMVEQRQRLVELGRASIRASSADRAAALSMVEEAISAAEREALVASAGSRLATGRPRVRPFVAALSGVAAVLLVAVTITVFFAQRSDRERRAYENKIRRTADARMTPAMIEGEADASNAAASAQPSPPVPFALDEGSTPPPVGALPSWVHHDADPASRAAVKEWTASVEQALELGPRTDQKAIAESAIKRLETGGSARLSLDEASALAGTYPIRLVVQRSAFDASRQRAELLRLAGGLSQASLADQPAPDKVDAFVASVDARKDSEGAGVRDALESLRARLSHGADDHAWFELVSTDAQADAIPSRRIEDILWWINRPAAWSPGITIRVPVEVIDPH